MSSSEDQSPAAVGPWCRHGIGGHCRPTRRRLLAAVASGLGLAASGCGFRPLYGNAAGGPVHESFSQIRVGIIPDRPGQILRNFLIQRLNPDGRPTEPRYALEVRITEREQRLAITQEAVAERNNLLVTASYSLRDIAENEILLSGNNTSITSFSILLDEVATLSAEQAARERALRDLSDQIRLDLALYFQRVEPTAG